MKYKTKKANTSALFHQLVSYIRSNFKKNVDFLSVVFMKKKIQGIQKGSPSRGFTLIEMLVSLSLFTVVLTMSIGTLLVIINANARAQSMQLIMSNLTFALDSMTREIRTGTDWYCRTYNAENEPNIPTDITSNTQATRNCGLNNHSGNYISVLESGGSLTGDYASSRITYYFDDDYYGADHGAILRGLGKDNQDPESPWVPLTGTDVDINFIEMSLSGTSRHIHSGDTEQPILTFYIRGTAGSGKHIKEFSLQTSVTQRSLDL